MVDSALAKQGATTRAVERWKEEMPSESEMVPKDKYTMFDRKEKRYRKGIHSEFSYAASNGDLEFGGGRKKLTGRPMINRIAEMDEG